MLYIVLSLVGIVIGALCMYLTVEVQRRTMEEQRQRQNAQAARIRDTLKSIETRQKESDQQAARVNEARSQFEAQAVSYKELQDENAILKRDLRNIDTSLRKQQLDYQQQGAAQEALDQRCRDLAGRYLQDQVKWTSSSLTPNSFARCKERLQKAIEWSRAIGFEVSTEEDDGLLADLKREYEKVVRAAFQREEQARIRAQIREEQRLEKEIERELSQLERERAAIQAALDNALAEAKDEHSAEVEGLRSRLAEALEKFQRAKSRAEMTKSGHVYVISNVGSFGDGVFKVGLTRRLEPLDRVRELGGASVPFPFDVHMMISSDDAPALENALHRELYEFRMNRANPRKEFFRTDMDAISRIVIQRYGQIEYVADAEALEYRQSIEMPDEDQEFIESVFDSLRDDGNAFDDA